MPAFSIDASSSVSSKTRRDAGLLLRPVRGQADAPLIPLPIGRHVIGSSPDAEVRLDVPGVDAQHAVLLVGPQRTVLKAFSRFTWVNDGVVRECAIKPGDKLCLGPVEFEVLKGKTGRRTKSSADSKHVPPLQAAAHLEFAQSAAAVEFAGRTQNLVSPANSHREQIIAELNAELLRQLSQLVQRETIAAENERRLVEQYAQIEGRRRIVDNRQSEIDRSQSELVRLEAEWQRKSTELTQQAAQLRSDRQSLDWERQKHSEQLALLEQQGRTCAELQAPLERRDAELRELQAALELRAANIAMQEQQHAQAVAQSLATSHQQTEQAQQFAETRLVIERHSEELREQQQKFTVERQQFESDRDKLFCERAHLAAREVEIADLRRQLNGRESEFENRTQEAQELLDDSGARQSTLDAAAAELTAREVRLSEHERALVIERNDLDVRKRTIDQQHAEWMLERHMQAARTLPDAGPHDDHAESQAEIEMLRGEVSELQTRLNDERSIWERERGELLSRDNDATTSEPSSSTQTESLEAEVLRLQTVLDAERAHIQQEREHWETEQDLLLRDRRALEAEWRRLESRVDQMYSTPAAPPARVEEPSSFLPPPIPQHFANQEFVDSDVSHVSAIGEVADDDYTLMQPYVPASDGDATEEFGEQHQAWSQDDAVAYDADESLYSSGPSDEYGGEQYQDSAEETESGADGHADAGTGAGEVLSLRAQLAELFGIQQGAQASEIAAEAEMFEPEYESVEAENQFEPADVESTDDFETPPQQLARGSFGPSSDNFESESVDTAEEAANEKSDEDVMSAYLARLLKRSPAEDVEAPRPTTSYIPTEQKVDPTTEAPTEDEQPRHARRMNAEEKETLRANLDSFRELANQQARAAVAKYQSTELKNGMQTTSVVAVLVTVVSVVLLTAELWSSASFRTSGMIGLATASALWIYTLANGMKVRRLKSVERAAAELTEALAAEEPAKAD